MQSSDREFNSAANASLREKYNALCLEVNRQGIDTQGDGAERARIESLKIKIGIPEAYIDTKLLMQHSNAEGTATPTSPAKLCKLKIALAREKTQEKTTIRVVNDDDDDAHTDKARFPSARIKADSHTIACFSQQIQIPDERDGASNNDKHNDEAQQLSESNTTGS